MKAFIKYLFIVITSFDLVAVACSKVEDCSFDSISLDLEYRQTPQTRSSSSIYNAYSFSTEGWISNYLIMIVPQCFIILDLPMIIYNYPLCAK